MSCGKFSLLSLRSLTALFEGLVESGPELVLQLIVVFHGVHLDDLALLGQDEHRFTWPWFRGVIHVLGILTSFVSLVRLRLQLRSLVH